MNEQELYDVTVIGGGPAGLYSTFYSGLREMKTKVIEFQPQLGGKIQVYPEKMIWDVGGLTPVSGAQLMEQLVKQAMTFSPEVVLNEKIDSIAKVDDVFVLTAASGRKHYSKTVIAAVGSGILKAKKLQIEGAERFEVSNIHYTVQSLKRFKDKTIVISGGGDTAIDWANELVPIAKQVYLTYRKDAMSGHEAQVSQLLGSSAICLPQTSITKLIASDTHEMIERIELTCQDTNEVLKLEVDDVIISHGYEQDSSLLKNSTLEIEVADDFYIAGDAMSQSSVPGLFAAGDILKHNGKLWLIAGAFQDAANAVNSAKQFIEPSANKAAMVSSHNEVFTERNRKLVKKMMNASSCEECVVEGIRI